MKKFLLGSVGLAALIAGPAMAADMPIKAPPPPPVAYYNWSGAYIGLNVGETWYDIDRTFPNRPDRNGVSQTSDSDGIFGFHAGAQWQWGAWVLGVEAALSACFKECRAETGLNPVSLGFTGDRFQQNKMTNLFTVGPRLGYAWDRLLIYGTGGPASASLKGQYCQFSNGNCFPIGQNGQSTNWGWYAGGGFDYVVHQGPLVDVILGAEYQHYDISSKSAFCLTSCAPASGADYDLGVKGDIVRARLTIKTKGFGFYY